MVRSDDCFTHGGSNTSDGAHNPFNICFELEDGLLVRTSYELDRGGGSLVFRARTVDIRNVDIEVL